MLQHRPPETLYELWSNLPPACNCVIITSAATFFSFVHIDRYSSSIVLNCNSIIEFIVAIIFANPPRASSIELSKTSNTIIIVTVPSSVSPMYILIFFLTASKPLSTLWRMHYSLYLNLIVIVLTFKKILVCIYNIFFLKLTISLKFIAL